MASWLDLLQRIADRADAIALDAFRAGRLKVREKADRSPVTEADLTIEDMARREIAESGTGLGVYGEEFGEQAGKSGARLIIDPIDATRNFLRGIPVFATLLAVEEAGEIVAGVVSAPALGARWSASRGGGAFAGPRRLHVSDVEELGAAQLFHGGFGAEEGGDRSGLRMLVGATARQRGFGDFWQHALVAEGCGEIAVDLKVQPYDIAALSILVEEAGGRATTLDGRRTIYGGSLVTSNGRLHDAALALLAG